MANWALAEMKSGEESLGEGLLSKGTCMCRSMTARESNACPKSHKYIMCIEVTERRRACMRLGKAA